MTGDDSVDVSVDGTAAKDSPLEIALVAGPHQVRFSRSGVIDQTESIRVVSGAFIEYRLVRGADGHLALLRMR